MLTHQLSTPIDISTSAKSVPIGQPIGTKAQDWSPSLTFAPMDPLDSISNLPKEGVTKSMVSEKASAPPIIPVGVPVTKRDLSNGPILSVLDPNTGDIPMAMAADVRPALIKGSTYSTPGQSSISLPYRQMVKIDLTEILARTPKPKGKSEWSSVHIIHCENTPGMENIQAQMDALDLPSSLYPFRSSSSEDPASEWNAIFHTASELILGKADRASLVIFLSDSQGLYDSFAAFIGMLPFRGVATALVSYNQNEYGPLADLSFRSPSGVFSINATDSARMGICPVSMVFGPLHEAAFGAFSQTWDPFPATADEEITLLPFAIGGLRLPMLTWTGEYGQGVKELAQRIQAYYSSKGVDDFYPVVSCGETVDRLGYGADISHALAEVGHPGWYFPHKSGETYKRYDVYGDDRLLREVKAAREAGKRILMIAVGGGVNGNSTGLLASLTGADFIEVPTTPMHYNDATTSAKKAFSLVVDDVILSKNILGCFYLPKLVFCLNESLLTISSASAHATVGEACKTMNMLGIANSKLGRRDYSNIMGSDEFASDFTKIILKVEGFEALVSFILDKESEVLKAKILSLGDQIASLRPKGSSGKGGDSAIMELIEERMSLMKLYREAFYQREGSTEAREFLTTINLEIVKAKAMFLAASDPLEKYRALLFEYAHTLGHGVEAFMNLLYTRARAKGIEYDYALKLHGQCVGMAVLWAGKMSSRLGVLKDEGLQLHQSFVFLFNKFGGFSFAPMRKLMDELGVTCEEFCEGVLKVVRRDNKRGYTKCDCGKSVDQLVCDRPGKMLRSEDKEAELRYLVQVDEEQQKDVLILAFDGYFDKVADLEGGEFCFQLEKEERSHRGLDVAKRIRSGLQAMYQKELEAPYVRPVPASRRNKRVQIE